MKTWRAVLMVNGRAVDAVRVNVAWGTAQPEGFAFRWASHHWQKRVRRGATILVNRCAR